MSKVDFLNRVIAYWVEHTLEPRSEIHPTHKTEDEKRLKRNKKARERRKRLA